MTGLGRKIPLPSHTFTDHLSVSGHKESNCPKTSSSRTNREVHERKVSCFMHFSVCIYAFDGYPALSSFMTNTFVDV